jgi:hypothetical protein
LLAQLASRPPAATLAAKLTAAYDAAHRAADGTLNNATSNVNGWVRGGRDVAEALKPIGSLSRELSTLAGVPVPSAVPAP